jgi:hypothetical protein
VVILISGCAVFKTNTLSDNRLSDDVLDAQLFESIEKQNLTSNGFNVQKAEIVVKTKDRTEKLLGSIRFEYPDKYLISIKTKSGIEVARAYLNKDTVLVNDRINKKMYFDFTGQFKKKYGFSGNEISLIFGDFYTDKTKEAFKANCKNGIMELDANQKGAKINYVIDCRKAKLKKSLIMSSLNVPGLSLLYDNYIKYGSGLFPGDIIISDLKNDIVIEIKIKKLEAPWSGNIDFIPGKNYEILQLP